jgi:hypothetical protein
MALPTSEEIAEIQALVDSVKEQIQDGSYVSVSGTLKRLFEYKEIPKKTHDATQCVCSEHEGYYGDVSDEMERFEGNPIHPSDVRDAYARSITVTDPSCQLCWLHECCVRILVLKKRQRVLHANIKRLIPLVMERLGSDEFSEQVHEHLVELL